MFGKVSPSATVTAEKVFTSPTGVRLKPDIVFDHSDRVVIADVAILWDDQERFLTPWFPHPRCLFPLLTWLVNKSK